MADLSPYDERFVERNEFLTHPYSHERSIRILLGVIERTLRGCCRRGTFSAGVEFMILSSTIHAESSPSVSLLWRKACSADLHGFASAPRGARRNIRCVLSVCVHCLPLSSDYPYDKNISKKEALLRELQIRDIINE